MAERGVGVSDLASGAGVAEYRTRERSVGGGTYCEQYLIPIKERVLSFRGCVTTVRAGLPSATAVTLAINNLAGSSVLVAVKSILQVESPATDAVTTAIYDRTLWVQTAATATGGNVMTKVSAGTGADAAETSNASVELRQRYAADGGGSSAITLAVGTRMAQFGRTRGHTQASQMVDTTDDEDGFPASGLSDELLRDGPIILRAGQSLAVQMVGGAPVAVGGMCSVVWEEYTLP